MFLPASWPSAIVQSACPVCVCECSGGMFCLPPSRTCSGANSTGPFMAQTAQSDELLSRRVRAQLTGWFASLHPGPAQVQTALVPSWHKQHRLTNCLLSRRVRAQLTGWFASIQYLLGDKNCDSSLEAKSTTTCPSSSMCVHLLT